MHCTNCSYPLWDISARTCPECGQAFSPAEYDFPPCGVRFCCPACDHAYYGTTRQGQLNPAEFACAGCGAPMSAAIAVVRLKPGVPEAAATSRVLPWLEKSRVGFWRGWWRTITQSLHSSRTMMASTPRQSSPWQAALYSLVTIAMCMAPLVVVFMLFSSALSPTPLSVSGFLSSAVTACGVALAVVGSLFGSLLVWIVTTHATLWLTGGPRWPIHRTAHAIFYSTGANPIIAFSTFGCCFGHVGFLLLLLGTFAWWAIVAARLLSDAQGVSLWRARLATLMVPVLTLALLISNIQVGAPRPAAARANAARIVEEQRMMDQPILSLFSEIHMAQRRLRRWPAHAMEIPQLTNRIYLPMLVHSDKDELFAGITARDLLALDLDAQRAKVDSFTASLPDRVLAVRIGPAVTLYHGLEQPSPPGVWLLLRLVDKRVEAITAQKVITHIAPHEFAGALPTQNARRAAAGLPPLPESVIDLEPGECIVWPEDQELTDDAGVLHERTD